jgi:hypothetical protein
MISDIIIIIIMSFAIWYYRENSRAIKKQNEILLALHETEKPFSKYIALILLKMEREEKSKDAVKGDDSSGAD